MPIGLVRLNERRQRPNQNITFLKTLDTPDAPVAQDILERVAAIVWPIMRDHHLGIMTLEEFPPNREFWGRNFNAGECVQLVLKSPTTGMWLPFHFIVKVMLHEMAHIKQMNHSRAFHAVRIGYQNEMTGKTFLLVTRRCQTEAEVRSALNARGYTGDGFWSTGHTLSGEATAPRMLADEELPENLCGGTYRRARKRVKIEEGGEQRKLTYAERQLRRKERKFGKSEGESLGTDEQERKKLEKDKGKSKKAVTTKPRVAQSQRGRELRAEAALKRLEASQRASTSSPKKEEDASDDDSTEHDEEEGTVDVGDGRRMVKVEEGGNDEDEDWKELQTEMKNLCATSFGETTGAVTNQSHTRHGDANHGGSSTGPSILSYFKGKGKIKPPLSDSDTETSDLEVLPEAPKANGKAKKESITPPPTTKAEAIEPVLPSLSTHSLSSHHHEAVPKVEDTSNVTCPVCTVSNSLANVMCEICACVLNTARTPSWRCTSEVCRELGYWNPVDAGVCSNCGSRKNHPP